MQNIQSREEGEETAHETAHIDGNAPTMACVTKTARGHQVRTLNANIVHLSSKGHHRGQEQGKGEGKRCQREAAKADVTAVASCDFSVTITIRTCECVVFLKGAAIMGLLGAGLHRLKLA